MSKRLRLAKYSKKIVCCNHCPLLHEDPRIPLVMVCQAGTHAVIVSKEDATGIPKVCPLEEYNE